MVIGEGRSVIGRSLVTPLLPELSSEPSSATEREAEWLVPVSESTGSPSLDRVSQSTGWGGSRTVIPRPRPLGKRPVGLLTSPLRRSSDGSGPTEQSRFGTAPSSGGTGLLTLPANRIKRSSTLPRPGEILSDEGIDMIMATPSTPLPAPGVLIITGSPATGSPTTDAAVTVPAGPLRTRPTLKGIPVIQPPPGRLKATKLTPTAGSPVDMVRGEGIDRPSFRRSVPNVVPSVASSLSLPSASLTMDGQSDT